MTERKLLEAAAKAAGIVVEWERDPAFIQERWRAMVPCGWVGQPSQREWQPLRENGDALELSVKMGLEVYHSINDDQWTVFVGYPKDHRIVYAMEEYGDDAMAATRRAIVRAAAAMAG